MKVITDFTNLYQIELLCLGAIIASIVWVIKNKIYEYKTKA